jgi:putative hemolysin
MAPAALEVSVILVLIFLNGLLAMTEMAVVSARKARLQQRVNEGDEKAQAALNLANEPGDLLSTVQIGITLIGILAGAFGGATVARTLAGRLEEIPALAPFSSSIAFLAVVLLISYFSLIFGELVPKRLALNNPEKVAISMARPMGLISLLASPLVRLLSFSTNIVLKLVKSGVPDEPSVTEEEVKVMIEQGTQAGIFEEAEQDMLEGVFRLADLRIENLITPRTEVEWLDLSNPMADHLKKVMESDLSLFPVAEENIDEVRGVVHAKDLLAAYVRTGSFDLQEFIREPVYVPQYMPALKVLELIKESRLPMALVIDEYGGLQGLVTVNDILEAVVGDMLNLGEVDEPGIVQREDGSYLLDGMLNIREVADLFSIKSFPGERQGHFQTLAGFIITYLGRIPAAAEFFEWERLRFEVVDMDGLRVDKVMVRILPAQPDEPTLK